MKKFICLLTASLVTAIIFCGCATESFSDSDITIEELEKKMSAAMDPDNVYAKSQSGFMKQVVTIPQFLDDPIVTMVETKILRPNKFSTTTYEDNKPVSSILSDGNHGWIADYKSRKISVLDGQRLQQLLMLAQLNNPAVGYRSIFAQVNIKKCSNAEGEFYLLECTGKYGSTFNIYVDAEDFFVRRIKGNFKIGGVSLSSDSRINSYVRQSGVFIPQETETIQGQLKQEIKLLNYDLNVKFKSTDFLPPVF